MPPPTRNEAMLTPKKRSSDSPSTDDVIKTAATEKAVEPRDLPGSCLGWLPTTVTKKGTAPSGIHDYQYGGEDFYVLSQCEHLS